MSETRDNGLITGVSCSMDPDAAKALDERAYNDRI